MCRSLSAQPAAGPVTPLVCSASAAVSLRLWGQACRLVLLSAASAQGPLLCYLMPNLGARSRHRPWGCSITTLDHEEPLAVMGSENDASSARERVSDSPVLALGV